MQPEGNEGPLPRFCISLHRTRASPFSSVSERALSVLSEHLKGNCYDDSHFSPLQAEDLLLVSTHDAAHPPTALPPGFVLRQGVHVEEELEQYQELHQAVFDGVG